MASSNITPLLEATSTFSPQRRPSTSKRAMLTPQTSPIKSLSAPPMSRSHSNASNTSNSSFHSSISVAPVMDRNNSSHSRLISLTSACAPVTSAYSTTPDTTLAGTSGISTQSSPSVAQRGWAGYDWNSTPDLSKDPPRTTSNGLGISLDDYPERPRHSNPNRSSPSTFENTILDFPSSILAIFLAPLATSTLHHSSPQLTGSTAPTPKSFTGNSKRLSLPLRLLTLSYLVFSIIFLALRLTNSTIATTGVPLTFRTIRIISPRASDSSPLAAVGFGDEGGSFAFSAWAKKLGKTVNWSATPPLEADSLPIKVELVQEENIPVQAAVVPATLAVVANEVDTVETVQSAGEGDIARIGEAAIASRFPESNPLTPLSHTYRFAKMHDKIHRDLHDEIEPFAFRSAVTPATSDVTACFYSNEPWLSTLPEFARVWGGPVSLVFEISHSRHSNLRSILIEKITKLRDSDSIIRDNVNFHFVGSPINLSERNLNKTRERLISRPIAMNFHQNLARFFASTDIVWMVTDARVVPSPGLRTRLRSEEVTNLVLARGDAIVVPTFGFVRDPKGGVQAAIPPLSSTRSKLGLPQGGGPWDGVSEREFEEIARYNVRAHYETLPLSPVHWPTKKSALVSLVSTRPGTIESPSSATLALYDEAWDLNRGPTNWYLWRKSATDPRLLEAPEAGGGVGLGFNEEIGGGKNVFKVSDYDLHYSPHLVISQRGQPWCTERFEHLQSACVYQIYLSGAELWVLPDEWTFTLEPIEKVDEKIKENPAFKLKNSISARLFGKFHQEACMHYGREFLSIQMWNSVKAQHLRATCERVLTTWGMGLVVQ